jgi:two-component system, NtrC family, sensor histidine kinase HydH
MTARKWIPVLLPFAVGLLGTKVNWTLASDSWRPVLASLYYIPIVIAAISLGASAAVAVGLVAGTLHAASMVAGQGAPWVQAIAQMLLFVVVGLTAATLAEWLRATPPALSRGLPGSSLKRSFNEVQDSNQVPALGRLVAGLVRQFRTPVTSIEGAGWVLEDSRLPDEKRQEFVGIIRKESHRLNRVLSDVLDFTQPVQPRFQIVDLSALVDEVIQLAGPKDHGPFFLFRKDIPPNFPPIRCDPEQIRQVLLNLAMNAIQASPGGGQIEISSRIEKDTIMIRMIDHGRGIPPSIVEKIFDPFFSSHENSLGLGLTVARHIVAAHRGKITVEQSSERGTCLTIALPAQ